MLPWQERFAEHDHTGVVMTLYGLFLLGLRCMGSHTVPIVLDSQKERFAKVLTLKKGVFPILDGLFDLLELF